MSTAVPEDIYAGPTWTAPVHTFHGAAEECPLYHVVLRGRSANSVRHWHRYGTHPLPTYPRDLDTGGVHLSEST